LYYDFDIEHAHIPHKEDESESKNVLNYSVLVDVDNHQASNYDVLSWKEGNLKLYSNNMYIIIKELIEVTI
jgi:alkyl hydroperoxide reductase subunit AhpC